MSLNNYDDFDMKENGFNNEDKMRNIKNEEFNIDEIKEELFVEEYNPSLGLYKNENINYMNAVLQCFAHITEITDQIINLHLDPYYKDNLNNLPLAKAYREILINIFFPEKVLNINKIPYNPKKLINILYNLNEKFKEDEYIELKNFLEYIIYKLHDELNTKKNESEEENSIMNISINSNRSIEIKNENDALIDFLQKFNNKNNSVILKNIYGIIKNTLYCHKCQNSFYNYQCYPFLYFKISKIFENKQSKYKKEEIGLNIYDCLDFYQRAETLLGDKGISCPKCKEKTESTCLKNIYSTKNILILVFDKENINANLNYTEMINLRDYVQFKKDEKKNKEKFYLCGIVNFLEDDYGKQNYVAFCKIGKNNDWYCYDDENVYPVTFQEIKNNGIPQILFYHKLSKKNKNTTN
jgi:ubiquitin C-terminal hydrolase